MSTIGKTICLGTAFLAGIAIAANAGPPGGADNSVALPHVTVFGFRIMSRPYSRSGVGPRVSSFETVRTEHYQVPEDYGANIALDPYKRGVSPRPGP